MARYESEGTWFERPKPHPCNCCGGPSNPERKHMPRCDHCWQHCRLGGPHQTRWFVSIDPGYAERGAVGYVSHAGGAFEYKPKLSDYARNALLDHMHAGLFNLPTPYERITKMEYTVSIKADDTTTITTPHGQRVTLKQAAKCCDDMMPLARRLTQIASTRAGYRRESYAASDNLDLLVGALEGRERDEQKMRAERDDARREARQAKAEAEESAKAAERARVGVIATNEENRRLRGDLIVAREQLEKWVCAEHPFKHAAGSVGSVASAIDRALHDNLPAYITRQVDFEESPHVAPGVCRVVVQTNGPAPALTPDTPVTLGMLRKLDAKGRELNDRRRGHGCVGPSNLCLAIGEALDRK